MSRKALKVVVELHFRAVSCPGIRLSAKDDIYLSIFFMGQYRRSECLPAVFPLLFYEKMAFEKIFIHAVDPGDIAVMLEYETAKIELVQLIPPVGDALAWFEEDARHFLFPEPKLVPSFSGVAREVLMTRAPHFSGIAPRLEFSTKTTISECPSDAETYVYPNIADRSVTKKRTRRASKQRVASPQRKHPQHVVRKRGRALTRKVSETPRSHSYSPHRAGDRENSQRLAQLSLGSRTPSPSATPALSEPGSQEISDRHPTSPVRSTHTDLQDINKPNSPLPRSTSTVRFSLENEMGKPGEESSSSEMHNPLWNGYGPSPSALRRSYREANHSGSQSGTWEEVQQRVRGLLTTPKAVRRLVYGATVSEIDAVLARRSISPGPP